MATSLYVNEDWTALVPAGSPEARFGITPADAKRRGLVPLEAGETLGVPEKLHSANVEPEPEEPEVEPEAEVKEAKKPADKATKKPATK